MKKRQRRRGRKILCGVLAGVTVCSMAAVPGLASTDWPDMGPANALTEDYMGLHRSVRDSNIRPDDILTLDSDNDLLKRAFSRSVDYAYDELVVGPKQFPLDEQNEQRINRHYNGEGYYTSTAIPAIWGTYHGLPGQAYRECFCARDVAHTSEAGALLALNEENYQMLTRFAGESSDLYWRDVFHSGDGGWSTKSENQKWWTLWSFDFYGDAYYMDAGFQELPAPFEVMDKIWTQYRWTGDERWIDDTMINYGMQLHSYDKFMKNHDLDGDGLADNGKNGSILPTLYEFEASGYLQESDVDWEKLDEPTGNPSYPYESTLIIKPDFFMNHSFYELPLTMKLIGKSGNTDVEQGENAYIVRIRNKEYDTEKPAVLKTFEQMSSRNNYADIHDVEIPVYVPEGVTFEVYNSAEKMNEEYYTVSDNGDGTKTITVKEDFFRHEYADNGIYRTNTGIVVRFSDGSSGMAIIKLDDSNVNGDMNVVSIKKNGTDVTDSLEFDPSINTMYLDYDAAELADTVYTLTIRHSDPVTPKKEQAGSLQEYCRIASDLTRVTTAGDTAGTQYQALLAMAGMIRARIAAGDTTFQPFHLEKGVKVNEGEPITLTEEMAQEYEDRAEGIREIIESEWRDESAPQIYARAVNKLGEKDMGWGHENSFFMPMKELLNPGEDTIKYLNFIQKNALLEDQLNEEAITYLPESFYTHGQNVAGWQWTKVGLDRLDPGKKTETEILRTYPEIALTNISNVVNLMMGVEPYAADNEVTTLPRLTDEVGWVTVNNIPLGQEGRETLNNDGRDSDGNGRPTGYGKPMVNNSFDLTHVGTVQSTLTNIGDETITWNAEFYGTYDKLYKTVDGEVTELTEGIYHKDTAPASTYCTIKVEPGETITVGTQKDPNGAKPNTDGMIYLSDQEAAFEDYPDDKPVQKDQTIGGTALYNYTFTEHYDKGLGVKPNTTIRYYLPEGTEAFKAVPTITDFVRGQDPQETAAEITFRVYLDGELKQTVTLNNEKPTGDELDIAIGGQSVLDLVAVSENQNIQESAAWLDARILAEGQDEIPSDLPDNKLYLTSMQAVDESGEVSADQSTQNAAALEIDGHAFRRGIGSNGSSEVTYELSGLYEKLDAVIGIQDGNSGSAVFKVYLDDSQTPVFEHTADADSGEEKVSIDLSVDGKRADRIRIVTEGDTHSVWGDMILTIGDDVDLTDPAIIAKKIASAEDIGLGQKEYNLPEIPVKNADDYTIEIASSSEEAVLALDGAITLDDNEHDIAVSFRITEKEGQKRSAVTREFVIYAPGKDKISLTKLKWTDAVSENAPVTINEDIKGNILKLDDAEYSRGIGMPAAPASQITYDLEEGLYKRFTATVGAAQNSSVNDNDLFRVFVYAADQNGKRTELYASPVFVKGPVDQNNHLNCDLCKAEIEKYGLAAQDTVDVDIPAGYRQLVIRTERIGDSFWGSCAIADPYFYLNSPYEGKEIESFEPISVQTVKGVKPVLPDMAKAIYKDMEVPRNIRVTWDEIDESLYQEVGQFTVSGTVEGSDKRPECLVEVKDKIILTAENASVVTTIGNAPVMPETVRVQYNDNSSGEEKVTWDPMDESNWAQAGKFTVMGTVDGTDIRVGCIVRVDDPNKVIVADMEPESETAMESVQRGTFRINGKDYENSIFAHADSELIYVLDGQYTRFTTTVGIKTEGDNPNVIFRGYGIDENGEETLLYDTNPVTRVADPSKPPQTTDENGYYYVGGNVSYDVDVDVTGFQKLKLVADIVGNPNTDHATYGTPILYKEGSEYGKNFHTITVTADEGGAVWPNGRVVVPDGESKEFIITPNPANPVLPEVKEMTINEFKLDETEQTVTDNRFLLENVDQDHTISVNFRDASEVPDVKYNVQVVNGSGSGEWEAGSTVSITADAAPEGQVFDCWVSDDGVEFADAQAASTTFVMPEKDVTVTAAYKESQVSKKTLEYFLNSAKEHLANGDVDDAVESVQKLFEEAIAEGEAVMAKEDATREEIMNAAAKLMKAIHALEMKAGDKTDLQMAVELADMIDLSKYVEAGQKGFTDAFAAAKDVLADGDAMQEDIDSAWSALVGTLDNLRLKANKDALDDLLDEVSGLDLSQYTEESAAVFERALMRANEIMADETLSVEEQTVVDEAVQALMSAKEGLVVKADDTGDGGQTDGSGNEDPNNGADDGTQTGGGDEGNLSGGGQDENGQNSGDGVQDSSSGTESEKTIVGQSGAGADGSPKKKTVISSKAVKTGDTAAVGIFLTAALASGAAVIALKKKRR